MTRSTEFYIGNEKFPGLPNFEMILSLTSSRILPAEYHRPFRSVIRVEPVKSGDGNPYIPTVALEGGELVVKVDDYSVDLLANSIFDDDDEELREYRDQLAVKLYVAMGVTRAALGYRRLKATEEGDIDSADRISNVLTDREDFVSIANQLSEEGFSFIESDIANINDSEISQLQTIRFAIGFVLNYGNLVSEEQASNIVARIKEEFADEYLKHIEKLGEIEFDLPYDDLPSDIEPDDFKNGIEKRSRASRLLGHLSIGSGQSSNKQEINPIKNGRVNLSHLNLNGDDQINRLDRLYADFPHTLLALSHPMTRKQCVKLFAYSSL